MGQGLESRADVDSQSSFSVATIVMFAVCGRALSY
jgi:hypothetical protein